MKRSKKKALKDRKLTIVKILPKNGTISQSDLDRWKVLFKNNLISNEAAVQTGEVEIQDIPTAKEGKHYLTLVRVGSDEYQPSIEDLEQWKLVFDQASKDPDFKIFTHKDVNIEVIELNKVIAIE